MIRHAGTMGRPASRLSLVRIALAIGSLTTAIGCGGAPELFTGDDPDGGPGPRSDADASSHVIVVPDSSMSPRDVTPGDCTPVRCSTDAATYCGKIGNGCG